MPDPIPAAVVPGAPAAAPVPAAPVVPAVKPAGQAAPIVQPTPPAKPVVAAPAAPAQPAATQVPLHELQQERDRRQALERELEGLRRAPQQQPPVQQAYVPIAQVDPAQELAKLWDTDPRKAVQVEIMYAMDWRDRVESNLNVQADQLAVKYPDFNNYRSQALSYVRTLPAHQRGAPGIIEASYQMLRGQTADSVWQQREADLLAKFQRGEFTAQQLQQPAGGYSAPPIAGQVTLSDQQIAAARMMKMTPEEYAKNIKLAPVR